MMVLIVTGSYLGGMALINGCSASALLGIGILESATEGAYTITYRQFASVGVPAVLLTVVPCLAIYIKGMGLKKSDFKNTLPLEYYQNLYKELGPMQGCEIRWLILTAVMVVWLFLGGHSTAVPLTCAIIAVLPVIGCVPEKSLATFLGKIPERFSEACNRSLSCALCPEKLCHHKKQLRGFLKKGNFNLHGNRVVRSIRFDKRS